MPQDSELELLSHDDVIWCLRWRQLYIMVPLQSPSAAHMQTTRGEMEDMVRRAPEGFACCVIVLRDAKSPTPEARQAIRRETDRFTQHLRCHCLLVHAQGFVASAALSIGGLMIRLRGGAIPAGLCKESDAAASFIHSKMGEVLGSAEEIQRALDESRRIVESGREEQVAS